MVRFPTDGTRGNPDYFASSMLGKKSPARSFTSKTSAGSSEDAQIPFMSSMDIRVFARPCRTVEAAPERYAYV